MVSLVVESNSLDFNGDTKRKSLDCNKRSSRLALGEVLAVNLVDLGELTNVNNKNIGLNNLINRRSRSFKDGLEVLENLAGVDLNVVRLNELAFRSQWDLTRNVDKAIDLDSLAVGANRLGSVGSKNLEINGLAR